MGWLSGFQTRKEALRAENIDPDTFRGAWVGNHYWFVLPADKCDLRQPVICLALLERCGPGDWAIKIMDETSGPYYWTCPKTLLDLVPDPQSGYSTDWRSCCAIAQERRRSRRLQRR